jgi:hypothetical protein
VKGNKERKLQKHRQVGLKKNPQIHDVFKPRNKAENETELSTV